MECAEGREKEKVEANTADERCKDCGLRSPRCGDKKNYEQKGQRNRDRVDVSIENFEYRSSRRDYDYGYDVPRELFTSQRFPHNLIVRLRAGGWTISRD